MAAALQNPITFSTLACPAWSAAGVVERAAAYGYSGLEWRGGPEGHVSPRLTSAERQQLRRQVAKAGLFSLAVTAYTSFTSPSPAERAAHVDDLRRHLDLAADLGAEYVRVFLGELPAGATPAAVLPGLLDSLAAAGDHAAGVGVRLAIEPHDDFVRSASVVPLLAALPAETVGVIWDVANAYAAGELPAEGYAALAPRLAYVQLKDGLGQGADWQLTPVGAGQVPLAEACALLLCADPPYAGAFSVEWEWAWHPELDPPEVALPAALTVVRALLDTATLPLSQWASFAQGGRGRGASAGPSKSPDAQ
jgi:sugar phosphate isomerase/epimerase